MYGGTIQNGVTQENAISGNVTIGGSGTFNMYGGTIKGGTYMGTTANTGGNVVVGGKSEQGTYSSAGTFKMYGGIIEGGKAYTSGNGGGNICCYNKASVMELWGGIVRDGWAKKAGGNVQIMDGTAHKIGGTVLITNGEAVNGGNIQIAASKELTMEGGCVQGGTATGDGGSIYAASGATLKLTKGTISGGQTDTYGGNIHLAGATFTMEGGTVSGGYAASQGGNISGGSNSQINISGGSVYGGSFDPAGSGWGGNIRAYNTTVNISGGYIYDGCVKNDTSNQNAGNIGALGTSTLNISGGNIGGDITYVNGNLTLSGAPKIKYSGLTLEDGTTAPNAEYVGLPVYSSSAIDISGLTEDAEIQVTGNKGVTFTASDENAAKVVSCFTNTTAGTKVALTDDGMQLTIVERVLSEDEFAPEEFDGQAYCPVCKDFKTWTVYEGENDSESNRREEYAEGSTTPNYNAHFHLYLNQDITYDNNFYVTWRNTCFNLNGFDVTAGDSGSYAFSVTKTLNLMDTKGDAVVTGNGDATTGSALNINGGKASATYNIYGGTYTKLDSNTNSSVALIHKNGGTLNLYEGATIDAEGLTGSAVTVTGAVPGTGNNGLAAFNMHGGEIKGGTAVSGGSVNLSTAYATFTMEGGTISGGTANNGGNISGVTGSTIEIKGGTIFGGTIIDDETNPGKTWGGNIRSWNGKVTISGGLIYGGYDEAGNTEGSNVAVLGDTENENYAVLNISGGTIVGDVSTSAPSGDFTGTKVTLSGAPKIVTSHELDETTTVKSYYNGLYMPAGVEADITGLTSEAEIVVTVSHSNPITKNNVDATEVLDCFTHEDADRYAALNSSKQVVFGTCEAGIESKEGTVWYPTAAEAVADYEPGANYLIVHHDQVTFNLTDANTDYYIESRGYTVTVTGTGKLYALDRANDDYKGFGVWNVGEGVTVENDVTNPVNGNRYIVIKNGAVYNAHRIEMGIKSISLRPDEKTPGLYYKAEYKCDATLAAAIDAYGVVLSVNDMPGADFADENDNEFTVREDFETNYNTETHAVSANSGSVFGIMKLEGRTAAQNAEYGDMKIYANAYILVDDVAVYVADTTNGGKQGHDSENEETYDANFGGVAYSLHDVMDVINAKWTTLDLNETQRGAVLTMLDNFKDFGMADWETSNITA